MTSSKGTKPIKRERQRITRTACEPCREKRAKCDGETPCGRCQNRNLDCHFTQRTWASKRSLQDEATSLREQLHRRERVLDALCVPDPSGDGVVRMLRECGSTYDDVYEKVHLSDGRMSVDTAMSHGSEHHRSASGSYDCETCWSPSTANSNMLSSTSGHSPFSFMDSTFADETTSQPSSISDRISPQQQPLQQHPDPLQQQMNPMQSIPWATGTDINSFGNMLNNTTNVPPLSSGVAGDSPTVIDPMLWPPTTSSASLGQPFINSWTGLMSDRTDMPKSTTNLPVVG